MVPPGPPDSITVTPGILLKSCATEAGDIAAICRRVMTETVLPVCPSGVAI
jgi:hypothetical protein